MPSIKLVLACNTSPCGVKAVLSQYQDDGAEKPVAFASRFLLKGELFSPWKRRLGSDFQHQIFSLIPIWSPFHCFAYHQPLRQLFSETKVLSPMVSGHIQRWGLTLSTYKYELKYRKGKDQGNCDVLSWLTLPDCPDTVPLPGDVLLLLNAKLSSAPITAHEIKVMTTKDPVLSNVHQFVFNEWPITAFIEEFEQELRHFEGCILWSHRVVVPLQAQETILKVLHESHFGSTRMKLLARG